ncbi:MAG: peptidylprolyl isomerase [Bacteroidetes bacterium]|nr:MAG: peptidylprolyl isomerase [Bacteroidota bacterium]
MKKLLLFITCLHALALTTFGQREIIDKVVANVGSEIVLLSEVEEQYALAEAQQGVLPEDTRCVILENLLAQKLLINQAKLDSIVVTEIEVEAQLNARIEQILAYMNGDESQFEAYYGQTVAEVKEAFREDLQNQLLADRMRATILEGVTVTPSEVKAFFEMIPKDSLPYFDAEVEIGEIVMKPEVNEEEREKARKKLEEIRKQIVEQGADFEEMAKKYSDDFGSGRIGGDLGWTKRGKFVPEFEAQAYKLDPGEISEVFESQFGFHIVQLLERRGNTIHTRHILVKPEITDADLELTRAKLDTVRQLILSDSITFSWAVKRYGYKEVQSYNNDGRVINPHTGNTFFPIADLDPDVYFAIDTMEVGGISKPFAYKSETGETLFRIIQLQSETKPHVANLETDYSKIQEATINAKKSKFINEWIAEKVNSTYITVDKMYDGCPNIAKWTGKAQFR